MKFLKQADYVGHVLVKLLKYAKISMQTFGRGLFENKKGRGASF